jgi:inorganic pyrophosphatase
MRPSLLAVVFLSCVAQDPGLERPDGFTIVGPANYLTGYPALSAPGIANVVVEIPAGTNAKWEVDKEDGALRWEFKNGAPRVVQYLPYPGNYGMIPRTLLPKELGGDGDPLDVIVLGPAVERGRVVRAHIVGVLNLLDGGEQDDKLLAVLDGSPLAGVRSVEELDAHFAGISRIVETWFENYKGPGEMESRGFGERAVALEVLITAATAFEAAVVSDANR